MKNFRDDWEVVQYVAMETSAGLVEPRVKRIMSFSVGIDGHKGWFEMYDEESGGEDFYASGGLWFTNNRLVDYDGVFSLPDEILDKLDEAGYDVDDIR